MTADERIDAAETLLHDLGVRGTVAAVGHDGSIAALSVPADEWTALTGPAGRALSERVRALGFRYVAIDLADPAEPGATAPETTDDGDHTR